MGPRRLRVAVPVAVVAALLGTCPCAPVVLAEEAQSESVLLAAGDIATCRSSGDEATAALLGSNPEGAVASLGDHAYPDGTLSQFMSCYEPSWGQHRARTRPALGNHEYKTSGAAGYFDYFGTTAGERGKGYYSYELGDWHVVVLNSNCSSIGGCSAGSEQEKWLREDLRAHARDCTLAYWHHPLFTSASAGGTSKVQPLFQALYEAGADVVLNGHAHNYERFAPQSPTGQADPRGLTEFVVGTGGASHEAFSTPQPNSLVRDSTTFGVLRMTLQTSGYAWQFVPVAGGSFTDSGTGTCATGTTPPPPANLLKNPSFEVDGNADGRPDFWTSNAKFTRSTAIAPPQGTFVGRHQAADPSTAQYIVGQAVASLVAGTAYSLTGWVNIPATSDTFSFQLSVTWRNASNAAISTTAVRVYTGPTGGAWDQVQATLTAPAGTTNAQVRMISKGLSAIVYVDDFVFLRAV